MRIEISLEDYIKELDLMDKQYGQEEELYPLINMILRANCNLDGLSLRDVHNIVRAETDEITLKKRSLLFGFGAFTDLAILDCNYNPSNDNELDQNENMLGCVEIKKYFVKMFDFNKDQYNFGELIDEGDECRQIICELLWFGKTIFTNGLLWYYLELDYEKGDIYNSDNCKQYIGLTKNRMIEMGIYDENKKVGKIVLEKIFDDVKDKTFKVKQIGNIIKEKKRSKYNIEQWNRLKYNLSVIDWETNDNISKFI